MTESQEHLSTKPTESTESTDQFQVPEDLARCAMVVEHAIEHLRNEKFPPIAVASALLGGALGILAQNMAPEEILRILDSAAQSIRAGDLYTSAPTETPTEAITEKEEKEEPSP